MKIPCPSCPDGNEWNREGPTGRACRVCQGNGYIGEDEDDSPYCECGNDPVEEELATGHCFSCGKELP